jgi:hypothetical protein
MRCVVAEHSLFTSSLQPYVVAEAGTQNHDAEQTYHITLLEKQRCKTQWGNTSEAVCWLCCLFPQLFVVSRQAFFEVHA